MAITRGFPVCSNEHPPINMRLGMLFVAGDTTQDETWDCPTCRDEFRCLVEAREIPKELRDDA